MLLKAPFPYFGGKSKIASVVWDRFGKVDNYVEPFCGSAAVLLNRPQPFEGSETINDFDGFISNFWRAMKADPEAVALHATNQVNECDLHARHCYLLSAKADFVSRLMGDPEYYDAKIAGWWAWGACCWIGSGWCSGEGSWQSIDGRLVSGNARQDGQGVTKQLPHVGDGGRGEPSNCLMSGAVGGAFGASAGLIDWFTALAERIRTVRVCCGDWSRVCGDSVTFRHGMTGVFLDPPYGHDLRDVGLYANDHDVTADVQAWCIEQGKNPLMRIALCGYTEYELPGWTQHNYKVQGGYGNMGDGRGRANSAKETIWFSPACQSVGLFA